MTQTWRPHRIGPWCIVALLACGGAADPTFVAKTAEASPPPLPLATSRDSFETLVEEDLVPGAVTRDDSFVLYASRLTGCPRESIALKRKSIGSAHSNGVMYFADGCGERVVYAEHPTFANDADKRDQYYVISRFSMRR
jgi:hypothetical protein